MSSPCMRTSAAAPSGSAARAVVSASIRLSREIWSLTSIKSRIIFMFAIPGLFEFFVRLTKLYIKAQCRIFNERNPVRQNETSRSQSFVRQYDKHRFEIGRASCREGECEFV